VEIEIVKLDGIADLADDELDYGFTGLDGHVAVTPAIWEEAFSYATYNFANVDIGHFVAGNNTSPLPCFQ
jgi:hypothetical protein